MWHFPPPWQNKFLVPKNCEITIACMGIVQFSVRILSNSTKSSLPEQTTKLTPRLVAISFPSLEIWRCRHIEPLPRFDGISPPKYERAAPGTRI